MAKRKLQRFAEICTFENVYSNIRHDQPTLINHEEEDVEMQGKWAEHFKNTNPITLEVGCGRGEYSLALGKEQSHRNFIGIDLKGERIWRAATDARTANLENLAFLRSRIEYIEHFFEQEEIDEIWITFPDPQLKKARKRLTSPRFLDLYRKILKKDGLVHLKTDSQELYEYTLEVLAEQKLEIEYHSSDIYAKALAYPELNHKTYYERLHMGKGKTITYIRFKL